MNINIDILQKFVSKPTGYFLCQRSEDKDAWLISPDIPFNIQVKQIGELPYNVVRNLAESYFLANIPLGKRYTPFQRSIPYSSIVFAQEVTCNVMELVVKCYQENITNYVKVVQVMESLTETEVRA